VLLGDSEISEGSQWEAIQLAAYYGASNLIGIIDVQNQFPQMVSLDGEVSNSTMAEKFAKEAPERFFEMFVAESLTLLRAWLRDHLQIAATLGYGPHYLHSTGQLHKGGPDTRLFLLITTDASEDLAIPGQLYGFATLQRAQALGDYRALVDKGKRVVRVHLHVDVKSGLRDLTDAMQSALPRAASTVP
jgi:hypothetical protein